MKEMNANGSFTASGVGLPEVACPGAGAGGCRRAGRSAPARTVRGRRRHPRTLGRLDDLFRGDGDRLRHALFRLFRLPHRLMALRAADRLAGREDPPDPRDRRGAEQAPALEEPRVLAVELLEGVVGEHGGVDLLGDAQQEGVASADGTGRGMDELALQGRLLEARSAPMGRSDGRRWRRR